MYLDAIEQLVELNTVAVEEIFPDILGYLKMIAEGGGSAAAEGGGSAGSVEAMVASINKVDASKTTSVVEMFKILSNESIVERISDNSATLSKSINGLSSAINRVDIDANKVEQVGILATSTSAIISVSRALTLSAPFIIAGALLSVALIPLVWGISKAFSFLSKETIEKMDNGGDALKKVGWSLAIFAGGMALAVVLIAASVIANPMATLALFAVIGLTALTFSMIGKYNENIKDGAWTIVGMSLSLMLFSFSVKVASEMMDGVSMMSMLKLGLVLGGTAVIFGLAGKFWTQIAFGALSFALIGLSLMLLTNPLESISKTIAKNSSVLWQLPVLLVGLGAVFALAGIPAVAILIGVGALAFGAIGLALLSIGAGLRAVGNLDDFDGEQFKDALVGVIGGFTAISWSDMITIPLKIPAILSMALAMWTIGAGMRAYSRAAGDWDEGDSDNFKYTIISFVEAFSMKGVDWDSVEDAIDATWYMGKNLEKLAKGIAAWESIDFDVDLVKENIMSILTSIPSVFADVGKMNKGGTEIFGFTFDRGDVEDGIAATMDMGENLVQLSKGVQAWEVIKFDVSKVKRNVSLILNSIPSVFARIGYEAKQSEGIFTDSNHIRGAEVVGDMAKTLLPLSNGVKAWQKIDFDVNKVKKNISGVLLALPSVFARIGYQSKQSEGIFSDSNHVTGAELVQSFSKPIKSVAELVKGLNGQNINPKNVAKMITAVFGALGKADELIDKKSMSRLWGVSGVMKKMGKDFPKLNKGLKEFVSIISKLNDNTVKSFVALVASVEKLSKVKAIEIKQGGGGGGGGSVAEQVMKEIGGGGSNAVKTKEEIAAEKKEEERRKKLPAEQQMVLGLSDMKGVLENILDKMEESADDMETLRLMFYNGTAKIAQQ